MKCKAPDGCERPVKARGLCPLHYGRWQRNGHIDLTRPAAIQRFESKYEVDASGCWLWTGALFIGGYGQFSVASAPVGAHRWSYEYHVGPIPDGLHLDHLCRVRRCVNPAHLEPVTCAENLRRSDIAPATVNARRTHCPKGHEHGPENTYVNPRGYRSCRTCVTIYKREKRAASSKVGDE